MPTITVAFFQDMPWPLIRYFKLFIFFRQNFKESVSSIHNLHAKTMYNSAVYMNDPCMSLKTMIVNISWFKSSRFAYFKILKISNFAFKNVCFFCMEIFSKKNGNNYCKKLDFLFIFTQIIIKGAVYKLRK